MLKFLPKQWIKFYNRICPNSRIHNSLCCTNWEWHKIISNNVYDRIEMVSREGICTMGIDKFVKGTTSARQWEAMLFCTATHWLLPLTIWLGHRTWWCGSVNPSHRHSLFQYSFSLVCIIKTCSISAIFRTPDQTILEPCHMSTTMVYYKVSSFHKFECAI